MIREVHGLFTQYEFNINNFDLIKIDVQIPIEFRNI